jgi:hypothetical protein
MRFATIDGFTYEFDGLGKLRLTDEFGTVDAYDRVDAVARTREQLNEFVGRYISEEIETTVTVQVDGDRLVVKRRPDATTLLTPVYADAFTFPAGTITFRRDSNRRIVALSVSQDRVWDLRFTRLP